MDPNMDENNNNNNDVLGQEDSDSSQDEIESVQGKVRASSQSESSYSNSVEGVRVDAEVFNAIEAMFAVQSRPSIDILRTLEPSDVVIYPSVITQTEFVRALKDFPVLYDDIEGRCGHCPTSKAAIRELSRRLGLSVKACYDRLYRIRNRKSPYDPLWHILMDRRSTIPSDEDFLAIVKSKLDGLLPSNRNKLKSFFLSKLAEF